MTSLPEENQAAAANVFGAMLRALHCGGRGSHWWMVLLREKDDPEQLPKKMDPSLQRKRSKELNLLLDKLYLQRLTGMTLQQYSELLQACGFMTIMKTRWGTRQVLVEQKLRAFLHHHGIADDAYELEESCPSGLSQQTLFVRLGTKDVGYHTSVSLQVKNDATPPRIGALQSLQRQLRSLFRGGGDLMESESGDESSDEESVGEVGEEDGHAPEISEAEFPILNKLGIHLDLSVESNSLFIKDLVGECFALQKRHDPAKRKATHEYRLHKSSRTVSTITVTAHKHQKAFERHHLRKPYLKELIDVMSSKNCNGAQRVANYLGSKHNDTVLEVGKERGLYFSGTMNGLFCSTLRCLKTTQKRGQTSWE